MKDRRATYRVLVGKPERKSALGIPRHRRKDNIKTGPSKNVLGRHGLDCRSSDMDRALLDVVMDSLFP
jgi:hypothetical protein